MYSEDLLFSELERDEGIRLRPYLDTEGKMTIGIGRNLDDIGVDPEEARYMCRKDIQRAESGLTTVIPNWRGLSDARQRVLINMCFNMGPTRLAGFKNMVSAVKTDNFEDAAKEMLDSKWAKQVGARAERLAEMMRRG
jgi:lysozyme